jgi:hypothetical protein
LRKQSRQGWDNENVLGSLGEAGVVVMVMVVVMGMNDNHYLRLRRIRYCEAEEKNES